MAPKNPETSVRMAFEEVGQRILISSIQPLRIVAPNVKKTPKYAQIAASIQEVGIIEPPIVARDRSEAGKFLLLDGHLRVEILKEMGETEVACLISTDDEAFTYNRRVSRIAIVQEHKMILNAVERGVPEERIAKALNVNVAGIRKKRRLLEGICPEAVELLKDKHVPINSFTEIRKMTPMRQMEASELMVAMNKYSITYARSLVAATPQDQLIESAKQKVIKGLTENQIALMERESTNLEREFKMAEQSYGVDHLDFVLAKGFLGALLGNARVVRYLTQHHREILSEFEKIAELESSAA
ncbi:plasmid partitioning protein RepB C-terminal domain-containing protein [Pseudorhodoplanes sp.]|uniref:plasmid partitioning protein RepB C-terminal domain-containing protein n=1 Tax=Pseudorhodoplanes sp. TaxID=1934341 RepID=UPI003D0B25AC